MEVTQRDPAYGAVPLVCSAGPFYPRRLGSRTHRRGETIRLGGPAELNLNLSMSPKGRHPGRNWRKEPSRSDAALPAPSLRWHLRPGEGRTKCGATADPRAGLALEANAGTRKRSLAQGAVEPFQAGPLWPLAREGLECGATRGLCVCVRVRVVLLLFV